MSIEYIRNHYRAPAKVGGRITFDSAAGTIVSARGQYLRVRIDNDPSRTINIHPTWRVVYLDVEK